MGQISVEIIGLPGSGLSGNQQRRSFVFSVYLLDGLSALILTSRARFHGYKKILKQSRNISPELFFVERLPCSSMLDPMMVRCVEGMLFLHDFSALIRKIFIQHVKAEEFTGK